MVYYSCGVHCTCNTSIYIAANNQYVSVAAAIYSGVGFVLYAFQLLE